MLSKEEKDALLRRAIEKSKCDHKFLPSGGPCERCGMTRREAMEIALGKQVGIGSHRPEPIYVAGRTFWDWLAELEIPKRKTLWKILGCTVLAFIIVGIVFFVTWFHHFGVEWARFPVFLTGLFTVFICIIGAVAILSEGFQC